MEIIIISAVVGLGYFFSNKDETPKIKEKNMIRNITDSSNMYDSNRVNEVNDILLEKATNNYINAEKPYETGVLPTNFNGFALGNETILNNSTDSFPVFNQLRIDNEINRNKSVFKKEEIKVDINDPLRINVEAKSEQKAYDFGEKNEKPLVNYLTGEQYVNNHNNMVPFFGGIIKQNPIENMSTVGLLDRYTGNKDVYKEKEALTNTGDIKMQNIHGNDVFPNLINKDRFVSSSLRQNERPFEEKRISALISGTFENKIRPEYKTIDQLVVNPKQVYNQRILDGQKGSLRGIQAEMPKNSVNTFYESNVERGFMKSDIEKSRNRNTDYDILYKDSTIRDDLFKEYSGNPHKNNLETTQRVEMECDNNSKQNAVVMTPHRSSLVQDSIRHMNIKQGLSYNDDYGAKNIDVSLTARETEQNYRVISGQQKTKIYQQDKVKTTLKEILSNNHMSPSNVKTSFGQGVSKAAALGISNYDMKTTLKEDPNIINNKYLGIADKKDGLGYLTNKISAPTTLKEILTEQAAYSSTGNPNRIHEQTVRKTFEDVILRDRKEISITKDRMSGPQKFNLYKGKESSYPNGIRKNNAMILLEKENTRPEYGFYSESIRTKGQMGTVTKQKTHNTGENSPSDRLLTRPKNALTLDILQ